MKKIFGLFLTLLALYGCDNEIDIQAERKNLSIIYAVLDPSQDSNYVRVQRGYLGDAAASASFDESDSIYYDSSEVEVFIREYENALSNTVLREAPLVYDDSKTLQDGIFTSEGFNLWRIPDNFDLNRSRNYQIAVQRQDGTEASGRTGLVGTLRIERPLVQFPSATFDGLIRFTPLENNTEVKMTSFQVALKVRYREVDMQSGVVEEKSTELRLPLVGNFSGGTVSINYDSESFSNALASRLSKDTSKTGASSRPTTFIRLMKSVEIRIVGSSESMQTFIELSRPSGGVNQNRPAFPQIINGTGIVTSGTRMVLKELPLEPTRFLPNLSLSNSSCDLNFVTIERNGQDTCWCVNNERRCF